MYPALDMATLRELRELANLTQKELADKVGVSKQHVSSWERGQYTPSPSSFRKICRALKCKRADLEFSNPDDMKGMLEARIDELEQRVETGSTLLTNMVTMVQESEERIDSQQAHIHALESILREHGLGDRLP